MNSARAEQAAWLIGIAGIFLGALGMHTAVDSGWINFFDNLHWTSSTAVAAALGWIGWQRTSKPEQRDTAFWMALGATGYAIGQLVWDVQVATGYLPFPAPADALYLTLGPCMTVALVRLLLNKNASSRRTVALLDIVTIAAALLTVTLVLYLPKRGGTEALALATLIAYPATMFTAVATLAVSIPTLRLRITPALVALFVGLLSTSLIWMRWNFLALDGQTSAGSWFNISFSVANLLVGYGLIYWDQSVNPSPRWDRNCEGILRQLPLLAVVSAAGSVVFANLWNDLPTIVIHAANAGAVMMIVLATIRQGTLLREHDELVATQAALNASQNALTKEQAQLKAVLTTMPDLVWLKDPSGVYLSCNRAFEGLYGVEEKGLVGKTDYDFVPKELADFFRKNDQLAAAVLGGRRNEETLTFARDGYRGIFETIKTPMHDADGKLLGVLGIARDISERKQAELDLRAAEARRKVATDCGRIAIWEVDIKSNQLIWDDNCFALYRMSRQDFTGRFEEWSRSIHPDDMDFVVRTFQNAVAGMDGYNLTFRIFWPDGTIRFIEAHGEVLLGNDGVPERLIGVNWDITEQKLHEEDLQKSVHEKSALLKEVHHRVKNNLQVISSLLRMETRRSKADQTKEVLGDMQARIRAMALLHESLYRTGTLASVDLGSYLRQVSTQAFQTQSTHFGAVQLRLDLGSVLVGMDQAIACGLLVNELISNGLKHGFPNGVTGYVSIELQPDTDQQHWCLRVCDTGVGLPKDFEERRNDSLGLQLATNLATQIGGELEVLPNEDKGVVFKVHFKILVPAPLVMPD